MQRGLLLDVVVRQRPAIFELFAGEDQPLLIRGNALLVLNLGFDIFNCVARLDFQRDRFSGESLDKDLHPTPKPEDKVERRFLLDVVVGERPAVLELLAGEDESLLIGWDSFLVLDLRLHVFNRVARLDLERDGLAGEGLDEDLHAATEPEDKMERRFLLDVVVRESPAVLELLPGEDEPLLVRGNPLLVLDFRFHVFNRVARLDLERDGLAGQGFDEDLHGGSLRFSWFIVENWGISSNRRKMASYRFAFGFDLLASTFRTVENFVDSVGFIRVSAYVTELSVQELS